MYNPGLIHLKQLNDGVKEYPRHCTRCGIGLRRPMEPPFDKPMRDGHVIMGLGWAPPLVREGWE